MIVNFTYTLTGYYHPESNKKEEAVKECKRKFKNLPVDLLVKDLDVCFTDEKLKIGKVETL